MSYLTENLTNSNYDEKQNLFDFTGFSAENCGIAWKRLIVEIDLFLFLKSRIAIRIDITPRGRKTAVREVNVRVIRC